jgi:[ribosomal protein S5]-alanine N-acetyltransferase
MARRDYFLKSTHLGFGRWASEDFALAQSLWSDAEVTRFIGGPFSDQQNRERLELQIGWMKEHGLQYWPVFLSETDEHVGCAGLRPYRLDHGVYELGIHLRQKFWGAGLAEEAGRAVIRHAFGPLGVKALFAGHHPENAASRRLIEKLGFRFTHEEFYAPTGLQHPSYLLDRTSLD